MSETVSKMKRDITEYGNWYHNCIDLQKVINSADVPENVKQELSSTLEAAITLYLFIMTDISSEIAHIKSLKEEKNGRN